MNFKILHLSDIHISEKEDNACALLRQRLIDYVKKNINNLDAVAVTGDIVDRYDRNAFVMGKTFIEDILEAAGLTKKQLIIVPGNHDMERKTAVTKILDDAELQQQDFLNQNWLYIRPRMEGYAKFIKDLEADWGEDIQYGCGIRILEKQGKRICFNLLNSAWSNKGNDDFGHLYIGREQLEYNRKKIQDENGIECVISMMHHPLSWLQQDEKAMLKDYLMDDLKFGCSIVLHGHIHDASMNAEENPGGRILSLISGIGYPKKVEREAGQPKISECRFSVYDLDFNMKKADCLYLKSVKNGAFVPDNELYRGSQDGHYVMYWQKPNSAETHDEVSHQIVDVDPVPVTACWSGREEELDLFSKKNTNVIVVSGVGGQGKTALAAEFIRRDADKIKYYEQWVWVDCREMQDTMHVKLLKILSGVTGETESVVRYKDEQLEDTIRRFINYIQQHKTAVVFDNVDAYVNFETKELINEIKRIVDLALTQSNESIIVLTCRTSIYDSRANFRSIRLDGLKEPEGIEYFRMREISVDSTEDLEACKKMIQITKGHPWWIGLLCGQMTAEQFSPREYLEIYGDDLLMQNTQLEKYFSAIWTKLGDKNKGEIRQKIIRFLVESARPLTVQDLSTLLNQNFNQTSKAVNHLYSISLLIEHDKGGTPAKSYQVHPLVREYIHKLYSSDIQKPLVLQLLELMMGRRLYSIIFKEEKKNKMHDYSMRDIIDSIETCLTSRNESEALELITYSGSELCNNGYLAEFIELSGRILSKINWANEQITQLKGRSDFLSLYLDVLSLQEHESDKVNYFLAQYEQNCEKNTIAYSGYLAAAAQTYWRLGDYSKARLAMQEYDEMKEMQEELRCPCDMSNLKGMIWRECGDVDTALDIFEVNPVSSARLGNIARCYQKKMEYDTALDKLRECLNELDKCSSLTDTVNRGYAYLWIAEIYYEKHDYETANCFMTMCQEIWKEYAPGLLVKTEKLLKELENKGIEMLPNQKQRALNNFLGLERKIAG